MNFSRKIVRTLPLSLFILAVFFNLSCSSHTLNHQSAIERNTFAIIQKVNEIRDFDYGRLLSTEESEEAAKNTEAGIAAVKERYALQEEFLNNTDLKLVPFENAEWKIYLISDLDIDNTTVSMTLTHRDIFVMNHLWNPHESNRIFHTEMFNLILDFIRPINENKDAPIIEINDGPTITRIPPTMIKKRVTKIPVQPSKNAE